MTIDDENDDGHDDDVTERLMTRTENDDGHDDDEKSGPGGHDDD